MIAALLGCAIKPKLGLYAKDRGRLVYGCLRRGLILSRMIIREFTAIYMLGRSSINEFWANNFWQKNWQISELHPDVARILFSLLNFAFSDTCTLQDIWISMFHDLDVAHANVQGANRYQRKEKYTENA